MRTRPALLAALLSRWTLPFPFSDFASTPNIGGFVAVEDHGTLEFLVNPAKG